MSEKTRRSADTIGESFKSIYSRYSNIKLGNLDEDGKSINDVETALARVNVKLRDNKDSFREFDDVLEEYVAKYQKGLVSEVDHLAVVNTLAGSRQKETLLALIENFDKVTEHQNAMVEATGSAKQKFDEVYSESLQAKLGDLQRSFEGLYESMLNSSMLGNSITTLTGFINGISNVTNTLGLMPTTITAVVGALTVFNSKFNESVSTMTHFTPIVGTWQTNLKNTEQSLIKQATSLRENITSLKGYNDAIVTGVDGIGRFGPAVANAGTKLGKLNMDLALTNVKLVAVKVSTIALQAVMSMGLSLAITTLISVVGKAIGSLSNLGKELKEFNDEYSNVGKDGGDFSYLLSKYSELEKKLKTVKSGTIEYNETEKELDGIQQTLATSYGEKISMIESDTEAKKLNLEATKKLNEEELILAQGNAKETFNKNNISNTDDVDKAIKRYSEAYKILDEFNEKDNTHILANLSESMGLDAGFLETLRTGGDLLPIVKENAEEATAQLEALYTATGVMSQTDSKWIDTHEKLGEVLGYTNDTINGTTNSIDELNNSDTTSGIDAITESAEEAQGAIDELNKVLSGLKDTNDIIQQAIDEFNQYGELTEDTYDKILSNGTPEMVVALQDSNTFLETYNRLLQEGLTSEEAQRKAIIAKANEILNTGNATADVVNQNAKNYEIDSQNQANSERSKLENSILYTNQSSKAVADMTTNNGKNYGIDSENLRGSIRDKLSASDSFANGAMNGVATFVTNAGQNYVTDANNFVDQTNVKIRAMEMLQSTLDSFASNKIEFGGGRGILNPESITINKTGGMSPGNYASPSGGYVGGSANAVNSGVGHGATSGSSGSGSGSSASEVKNMESLTDRYHDLTDAIEDYQNAIDKNKLLQENATEKDKIKLMEEEIELYKKQQNAVKALTEEQKKEAQEIKNSLSKQGVKFDASGDISNYNSILNSKVKWANSLSGDAKENAIAQVKALEEAMKNYDELVQNSIPEQEREWISLNNTIKEVYKTQVDLVAEQEKNISEVIKYELEKRAEAKKKALDKEKEMYNKQYEEENFEEEMNQERSKLAEIQAQINRVKNDSSRQGKVMLEKLMAEYDEQMKIINDKIKEQQNQAINDRFDAENELIDKELEDSLSAENLTQMISQAMTTGMISINGEVISLQNSMATMLKETEVGFVNVASQQTEWINNLKEIQSLYTSIGSIMTNAGVNTSLGNASRSVSVTTGGITINGNADQTTLTEIKAMLDDQAQTIYKNIAKKLG